MHAHEARGGPRPRAIGASRAAAGLARVVLGSEHVVEVVLAATTTIVHYLQPAERRSLVSQLGLGPGLASATTAEAAAAAASLTLTLD
jgi:NAD(P)H-hydrate repair Nnr-like enzyme with NAD(P)H-hydrate dehydratase domain